MKARGAKHAHWLVRLPQGRELDCALCSGNMELLWDFQCLFLSRKCQMDSLQIDKAGCLLRFWSAKTGAGWTGSPEAICGIDDLLTFVLSLFVHIFHPAQHFPLKELATIGVGDRCEAASD